MLVALVWISSKLHGLAPNCMDLMDLTSFGSLKHLPRLDSWQVNSEEYVSIIYLPLAYFAGELCIEYHIFYEYVHCFFGCVLPRQHSTRQPTRERDLHLEQWKNS